MKLYRETLSDTGASFEEILGRGIAEATERARLAETRADIAEQRVSELEGEIEGLRCRWNSDPSAVTVTSPTNWKIKAPLRFAWGLVMILTIAGSIWFYSSVVRPWMLPR